MNDTNKMTTQKKTEQYILWINLTLKKFHNICAALSQYRIEEKKVEMKNLKNLNECLIKVTWEYCSCNLYCARMILEKIDFSSNCALLKQFDLKSEQTFVDCNFLRIKRFYGKDELPIPYNSNFQDTKNIFSDIQFACILYGEFYDVQTCIFNFFYDPGYLRESQKDIVFDFYHLEYKICNQIKFNAQQQQMIQKTDYISTDVVLHIRNKRSFFNPFLNITRKQTETYNGKKHKDEYIDKIFMVVFISIVFSLLLNYKCVNTSNKTVKITLLMTIGIVVLMYVIIKSFC